MTKIDGTKAQGDLTKIWFQDKEALSTVFKTTITDSEVVRIVMRLQKMITPEVWSKDVLTFTCDMYVQCLLFYF